MEWIFAFSSSCCNILIQHNTNRMGETNAFNFTTRAKSSKLILRIKIALKLHPAEESHSTRTQKKQK